MDIDTAFVLVIAVLLAARVGFKRNVPLVAFYVASAGWGLNLVWGTLRQVLDYVLTMFRLIEHYDRYEGPSSILGLVSSGVHTVTGLVLIVAVLLAARGAPVEAIEPPKE